MSKFEHPSSNNDFIEGRMPTESVVTPIVKLVLARYEDIDRIEENGSSASYDSAIRQLYSERWGMPALLEFTDKADEFIDLEQE